MITINPRLKPAQGTAEIRQRAKWLDGDVQAKLEEVLRSSEFRSLRFEIDQMRYIFDLGPRYSYRIVAKLFNKSKSRVHTLLTETGPREVPIATSEATSLAESRGPSLLTESEENEIVEWINKKQRKGNCATPLQVRERASRIYERRTGVWHDFDRSWWKRLKRRHEELQKLSTDCCAKEDEEEEEPGRQRELGQLGEEATDVTATSHLGTEAHKKTADDCGKSLLVVLDVPDLPLSGEKTGDCSTKHDPGVGEGRLAAEEAVCLKSRVLEDAVSTGVYAKEVEQEGTPVSKGAGDAPGASNHAKCHREDDDENRTGVIGPLPLENDVIERGPFKLIVLIHFRSASP